MRLASLSGATMNDARYFFGLIAFSACTLAIEEKAWGVVIVAGLLFVGLHWPQLRWKR